MSPNVVPFPGKSANPVADWLHWVPAVMETEGLVHIGIDIHFRYDFICPAKATSVSVCVWQPHTDSTQRIHLAAKELCSCPQYSPVLIYVPLPRSSWDAIPHDAACTLNQQLKNVSVKEWVKSRPVTNFLFTRDMKEMIDINHTACKHANVIYINVIGMFTVEIYRKFFI